MSLQYVNIPGVQYVTLDGGFVVLQQGPASESLLILGPALDGPNDQVVPLGQGSVETLFGPLLFSPQYPGPNGETGGWSGNALVRAVREAQKGGAADIRVLRVGGSKATGTLSMAAANNNGVTGTVTLTAKSPGRHYHAVSVAFASGAAGGSVTLAQPTAKGGSTTFSWSGASSGLTVSQLIDRINSLSRNTTVELAAGTINVAGYARKLNGTVTLAGGTDGTEKDDNSADKTAMYSCYTAADSGAFAVLADYQVDHVALAGIYLDDRVVVGVDTTSIAGDFATFLAQRSLDHPMLGHIATRPIGKTPNKSNVDDYYDALVNTTAGSHAGDSSWLNAGYFLGNGFTYSDGSLEQSIDSGGLLSVVAIEAYYNDPDLGVYRENSAAYYAGKVSALPPHRAMTHKPADGLFGVPYYFTRAQMDTLNGGIGANTTTGAVGRGAYVTLIKRQVQGTLFCQDVTAASRNSDYRNLQIVRIAHTVHHGVEQIAFPYLGEPNDEPNRLAMTTQIKSFLDGLAEARALNGKEGSGYTLSIRGADSMDALLGRLTIDLTLRPALQIKRIIVRIRMRN